MISFIDLEIMKLCLIIVLQIKCGLVVYFSLVLLVSAFQHAVDSPGQNHSLYRNGNAFSMCSMCTKTSMHKHITPQAHKLSLSLLFGNIIYCSPRPPSFSHPLCLPLYHIHTHIKHPRLTSLSKKEEAAKAKDQP